MLQYTHKIHSKIKEQWKTVNSVNIKSFLKVLLFSSLAILILTKINFLDNSNKSAISFLILFLKHFPFFCQFLYDFYLDDIYKYILFLITKNISFRRHNRSSRFVSSHLISLNLTLNLQVLSFSAYYWRASILTNKSYLFSYFFI